MTATATNIITIPLPLGCPFTGDLKSIPQLSVMQMTGPMKQRDVPAPEADVAGYPFMSAPYLHVMSWMMRTVMHWMSGTGVLFNKIVEVPTPGLGEGKVRCSVCVPEDSTSAGARRPRSNSPKPLIIVAEGGGFIMGEPNDGERNCRNLADKVSSQSLLESALMYHLSSSSCSMD